MIEFKNVSKLYPPNYAALQEVSFYIKPKEFVSIVGQSGAGKTTLIKLLIAQERFNAGSVTIGGWNISDIRQSEIPALRRQIGVAFQDFKILPQKTVYENVSFALEVCGAPSKHIDTVVPKVLRIVGLDHKADRYPNQISGGEVQRVCIARALVHRPKILLADEPTGNLDSINTKDIIDLLLKINEFGTTVLLVTHNREVVNRIKRRVITLENGKIVSDREAGKYVI